MVEKDKAYSAKQVKEKLASLENWSLEKGMIVKDFQFTDFNEALMFVNKVAVLAEAANHHPDIELRYNKVRLGLVTHSAKGITQKDFNLVKNVDKIKGW